jgi:hypothetical protein
MALFGASSQGGDRDAYSPVHDDEGKPLQGRDAQDSDHESPAVHPEIYALSRSLRRTNLFLKVIIGLLSVCIIALLSINVPDTVKKVMKQGSCTGPLLKTPVPDCMSPPLIHDDIEMKD